MSMSKGSERLMPYVSPREEPERLAWSYAMAAALVPMMMGYDVGVMSGSIDMIQADFGLSSYQAALVVAIFGYSSAVGGLFSGWLGDLAGRKGAIALAAVVCIAGAAVLTFAVTYVELMAGRIVLGFGCGCAFLQAPMYTAEIAPPDMRGRTVALTDMSINFGILLGYVVGYVVESTVSDDDVNWRYMVSVGMALPLVILIVLLFIPESPRWLIVSGYHKAAQNVLNKVSHSEAEALETYAGMQRVIDQEHGGGNYSELFCSREKFVQHAVAMVLLAGILQQVNGSETVVNFSPDILEASGLSSTDVALGATIAVGLSKLVGDVLSAMLLDAWGRRPIMITSTIGTTASVVILGLCLLLSAPWGLVLFVLCLFMAFFSFGLGCVTFLVCNELVPIKLRSKTVGLALCGNRILSATTILAFRTIATDSSVMSVMYLCLFSVGGIVTTCFYYFLLPETANKTLEEIQLEMYNAALPSSPYETIE